MDNLLNSFVKTSPNEIHDATHALTVSRVFATQIKIEQVLNSSVSTQIKLQQVITSSVSAGYPCGMWKELEKVTHNCVWM